MAYGDDHQALRELRDLVEENNKILRGLRRTARWTSFFSFIKWLVILGSIFASYYYLQPYFDSLKTASETVVPSLNQAMELLKNLSPR
ncbi:MAG: hypothetical protein AAB589_01430 [Patescibacteria group bacterium]